MRNVCLPLAIALMCGPNGNAQADSSSLHARYGEATVERFVPTPQIELLVNYGADRQACEILIQPTSMSIFPAEKPFGPMMDETVVSQILEEVSPVLTRGKGGLSHVTKSGCNENSVEEFDMVTVSRTFHRCDPTNEKHELSAWVTFKRSVCDSIAKARMELQQADRHTAVGKPQ
jgi:hypothetical protein